METQAPFESQSAIMWPDWSNPNAPQSPVDSGTVHDNHQNQYSPTENGPSTWWSDGYLVPLSSSSVPLTSDNPQPDVLLDEEASTEPVRGERRKVGTLAIVQASRRRRGINPKSGEMRSSRFYCPEYECDREFTTKQNYDDHLRRHAGKKPFECTVCQKASFTNRSDLNRHQTSEKCEKSAALLTTTK
ncbi:hypothetical protein GYMLUDRAFT_78332 [Collybiopsis luxurians FD-317 M1]|uniref:Unplaced genomic scaffold GYMLUscaffold_124, whole genome shotgun sequence n=1 Tax=Collybiopsis luxurians FD-317 M1 TaxID=944289 RepID=A0A0D0BNN6_9AGAR|nr:hypothetical protein GYMLUDRAFT_78332 [Collybiopsis luxurians FD-317 M1]